MLLVKTYLAPSSIEGLGLFAAENIAKGAVVWEFAPLVDKLFDAEFIASLPPPAQEMCRRYSYLDSKHGAYVYCGDDARFVNHSDAPNTEGRYPPHNKFGFDIAVRDIAAGEEITCDYRSFDAESSEKLGF
jgi:uncharacterized protein